MNITYWNMLNLSIQLSAHNCGSVSPSEGTGNIWFLIWWSKEPKVKDKGCSSQVPQRHWTAEPQEPDHFLSLLYPWRPRDCRGWDAGVCHTLLSPCRHRWQEDGAQLAGRALQGSVLALPRSQVTVRQQSPGRATPWPGGNDQTQQTVQLLHFATFSSLWQTTLHLAWMERSQLSVPGAEPRPPCAHGCFFPGDSQFLALVALG